MSSLRRLLAAIPLVALTACAAESDGPDGDLHIAPIYDQASGRVVLELSRPLSGNEQLRVRSRRGSFGALDCAATASFAAVADTGETRLTGPAVDAALTRPFYGPEWGQEPTAEMLAQVALGTDSIIDVCVIDGARVVGTEFDLFEAWDRDRAGHKVRKDATGEERIQSAQKYGERCVGELGEIPFFQKQAEGDYSTFNCLDATPVPVTQTAASGTVTSPTATTIRSCDKPQYIYSSCESGPRVATRINDQGTRWTLLCRKSIGGLSSSKFNDIAMIGHNPFTGKTCFFQNALYQKTNGAEVPHPADVVKSTNLWSGVHGGLGTGIQCADCHDADAFVHTPWIDGAKDASGRTIVPKMGEDLDMPMGANDAPYSIVNLAGQGWRMHQQITSPEANACLRCHRMAGGKWLAWAKRLDGTDNAFRTLTTPAYRSFEKIHWMPPNLRDLTAESWPTSDFGKALNLLKRCAQDRTQCQWADVPATAAPVGDGAKLHNPVALDDTELARQAAALLGVGEPGASSRCGECHSLNKPTLLDWQRRTDEAMGSCLAETLPGAEVTTRLAEQLTVTNVPTTDPNAPGAPASTLIQLGFVEVAPGGHFEARLTGTGDADLYVRRAAPPTLNAYDCRPYAGGSDEVCGSAQLPPVGYAKIYIAVAGFVDSSVVDLDVSYNPVSDVAKPALDIVSCLRTDPSRPDSPFMPAKVGIYAAAAHLGWFQRVFQGAYPLETPGNTGNTWIAEFLKFRQRVGMPKGNHPRFTQAELDIVATWFARGLPKLGVVVPDDDGTPTQCTPSISADLIDHATSMATIGWGAVNKERGMTMFGCAGASDPKACLASFPAAADKPYASGWTVAGTQLRILRELSFKTHYWMRSSADGRFIANGAVLDIGGMTSDLQTDRDIPTHAAYDPGFFPDNSGFVFQNTPIGTGFCNYNLLTSNPAEINFSEPECSSGISIGLYQHLGAGLTGDYFTVNGQFTSDNGAYDVQSDPVAGFSVATEVTVTPMVHAGNRYEAMPESVLPMPFEGDSILSPSTRLMVNRLAGPEQRQLGFVVRQVNASPTSTGYAITAPEVARYCVRGGKPAISFDERFMVYHHYVEDEDWAELGYASAADPAFVALRAAGAANLYVLDLVTGVSRRVTAMGAGQYALFPHFRSDGWIYFLVRDLDSGREYAVASDAALN